MVEAGQIKVPSPATAAEKGNQQMSRTKKAQHRN